MKLLDGMFSPDIPEQFAERGMVFMSGSFRRTLADIGRIVVALEAKLATYLLGDLANAEEWL